MDWFLHLREQSFADSTKLGGVSESPAHVAVQWDLNGTEIFTGRNLMKFNEREMSCPAPGEEQAPCTSKGCGKQLCRKGLGDSGGYQTYRESGMCS